MDVRDVGVALWRQRPLVVLILAITGAAPVPVPPPSPVVTKIMSAPESC